VPDKIFVGNVSFNASDADLEELCSSLNIQTESVRIMRDMATGRSRGFAFVELKPESDLAAAIQELNGKMLDGRALSVNEARPQQRRENGGGGRGFGRGSGRPGGRSARKGEQRPKRKIQELY